MNAETTTTKPRKKAGRKPRAKESTLTAFYTPPVVIDAVWRALGNMGFVRGNVLEPSCGSNIFEIPKSVRTACPSGPINTF